MTALHRDIERIARLGWRLYPASSRSKAACVKDPSSIATNEIGQLNAWAREFPGCNWRMVCEGSGVWALDVDVPGPDHAADGVQALKAMVERSGPLPRRPTTRSGGGGMALFFLHRGEPIHGQTGHPTPGLDPRRGRLSVTLPPSRHVSTGRAYRWIVAPWECPPPPAPAWLLAAVAPPVTATPSWSPSIYSTNISPGRRRRYAEAALRNAVGRVAAARQGQRNATLNSECFSLVRLAESGDLSLREIAESMAVAARHAGLAAPEVQATLRSALRAGGAR